MKTFIFVAFVMSLSSVPFVKSDHISLGVKIIAVREFRDKFKDEENFVIYADKFLSAVNLWYKDMVNPSLELILTETAHTSEPIKPKLKNTSDISEFLKDIATLGTIPSTTHADIVYVMTSFTLDWSGKHQGTRGAAHKGGVCSPTKNIAIGEDDGKGFSGVGVAAQLIARLVGASYDGEENAEDCSPREGFLMSNRYGKPNNYMPSVCTRREINYTLGHMENPCWTDVPTKITVDSSLPLNVNDKEKYCNKLFPAAPNKKVKACKAYQIGKDADKPCLLSCCMDEREDTEAYKVQMPDGTICKPNYKCINGGCERVKTHALAYPYM